MKAYHFSGDLLRGRIPVPAIGEKLVHTGKLKICASGLHASKDILDALYYAPSYDFLHVVECTGRIIEGEDKLVCTERTIIKTINCDDIIPNFARWCALQVVHLWECPALVLEYLETGKEDIRTAAWNITWDVIMRHGVFQNKFWTKNIAATYAAYYTAFRSYNAVSKATIFATQNEDSCRDQLLSMIGAR